MPLGEGFFIEPVGVSAGDFRAGRPARTSGLFHEGREGTAVEQVIEDFVEGFGHEPDSAEISTSVSSIMRIGASIWTPASTAVALTR